MLTICATANRLSDAANGARTRTCVNLGLDGSRLLWEYTLNGAAAAAALIEFDATFNKICSGGVSSHPQCKNRIDD